MRLTRYPYTGWNCIEISLLNKIIYVVILWLYILVNKNFMMPLYIQDPPAKENDSP